MMLLTGTKVSNIFLGYKRDKSTEELKSMRGNLNENESLLICIIPLPIAVTSSTVGDKIILLYRRIKKANIDMIMITILLFLFFISLYTEK